MKYHDNMTANEAAQLLRECEELDEMYAAAAAYDQACQEEYENALRGELKNAGWTDEQIEEEIAMLREWGE